MGISQVRNKEWHHTFYLKNKIVKYKQETMQCNLKQFSDKIISWQCVKKNICRKIFSYRFVNTILNTIINSRYYWIKFDSKWNIYNEIMSVEVRPTIGRPSLQLQRWRSTVGCRTLRLLGQKCCLFCLLSQPNSSSCLLGESILRCCRENDIRERKTTRREKYRKR